MLALLPAVLAVGIAALAAQLPSGPSEDISPVRFSTYHGLIVILVMLFAAAQGPELFGRDQRYGVLPLYFSRVLTRIDYAMAKTGGLWLALLLLMVIPQVLLLGGRIFVAPDPVQGVQNEIGAVPRFMAQAVLTAGLLGSLTALVASHTPRRAYATAIIIAIAIIPPIVVGIVGNLVNQDSARLLVLFSPGDILDGTNAWIYGTLPESPVVAVPGPAGRRVPGRGGHRHRRGDRVDHPPLPDDHRMTEPVAPAWGAPVPATEAGPPVVVPALQIDHVSRWYGNVVAVNDVSFALGAGVTGLLGPNGAGKSTLLHLMAGLLRPSAGQVSFGAAAMAAARDLPRHRPGPREGGGTPVPVRLRVRAAQRQLQGVADPKARRGERSRSSTWSTPRTVRPARTPRACANGRSSPAPSSTSRRSCCSTNRSMGWTRASACT